MTDPAWETSKENVAPVIRGRNVQVLNNALTISKADREEEHQKFKDAAKQAMSGTGPYAQDPLYVLSKYAKWTIANYPEKSDPVKEVLETICRKYAKDERYRDDIRFVRLWIHYADVHPTTLNVFQYMLSYKIGFSHTLFYEGWASTLERHHQFDKAHEVYNMGIKNEAHPIERLQQRQKEFFSRMAARKRRDERRAKEAAEKKEKDQKRVAKAKKRDPTATRSALADAILAQPSDTPAHENENDENPRTAPRTQRVRPALGQISSTQAKTGRRPTVVSSREPSASKKPELESRQSSTRGQNLHFEIYQDPKSPHHAKQTSEQSNEQNELPLLPKRDEVCKEDNGRLPSKWNGETLTQDNAAKNKMRTVGGASNSLPFEIYRDEKKDSPLVEKLIQDARRDVGERKLVDQENNSSSHLQKLSTLSPAQSNGANSPTPAGKKRLSIAPSSPTQHTKIAEQALNNIWNGDSDLSMKGVADTFLASVGPSHVQTNIQPPVKGIDFEIYTDKQDKENAHEKPLDMVSAPRTLGKRVLQTLGDLDHMEVSNQDAAHNEGTPVPIEVDVPAGAQTPNAGKKKTNDDSLTDSLTYWCFEKDGFRMLDDNCPDLEVNPGDILDLNEYGQPITFNVEKRMWSGYRGTSSVVIAEDLENSLGIENNSSTADSDDENIPRVTLKISGTSNLWEFFIYKSIQERSLTQIGKLSRNISQVPCLIVRSQTSFLVLESAATCSLNEILEIYANNALPEELAMFFVVEILKSLEALHAVDIIHSDVTLDNVLFRNDPEVELAAEYYSATGDGGWSSKGILLVDYNHAVDGRMELQEENATPPTTQDDMERIAKQASKDGNSFLDADYRIPSLRTWAFNADCYAVTVCAAKLLGAAVSDFNETCTFFKHGKTWSRFVTNMRNMTEYSTPAETIDVIRQCREEMEAVLSKERDLQQALLRLSLKMMDMFGAGDNTTTRF